VAAGDQRRMKVFISYAREDKMLRDDLDDHLANLKQQGIIETWHDGEILAGQAWEPAILEQLETADVILLLISAKFLASPYINSVEMKRAMQRHEVGEARVIPVLLRPVFFKNAPFASLEMLPKDSHGQLKAITKWSNRDEAYAKVAEGIHRAVSDLQTETPSDSPRSTLPMPSIWNVPHQRNPNFTGRDELLTQLQASLRSGQATALTQQAIHGLGGVGKTQLAVEHAFRHTADYDVVWWIRSEQTATLAADYAALAQRLDLAEKDATEQAVVVEAVRRWLDQHSRWLLIFDNVNEPKDLDLYRPQGSGGQILITSRYAAWRGKAQPLEVEELDRAESIKFLLKRTGQTDESAANKLAEALGDLPLALEHAGAYVDATGISLAEYLKLFESYQTALFDEEGSEPTEYPVSITKTWDLAFQQVQQQLPAAVDLLNLCAFFAPDDIPLDMIRAGTEFLPEGLREAVQNPLSLNKAIAALRCYSLIDLDDGMLSVHRMVQAVTRDRMSQEERERWIESVVGLVNESFPLNSDEVATWAECARLLPHAFIAARYAEAMKVALDITGELLNQVGGGYLRTRVLLPQAKLSLEQALRIDEDMYGSEHPTVARDLSNLSLVLRDLGDLVGAKGVIERALHIDEDTYGSEHQTVAIRLNNLGLVLSDLGDLFGAKAAYERALRIDEVIYGTEDAIVAIVVNNLGNILQDLRDLEGAKVAYERALRISEAVYGPEHLTVATMMNNLGSVLRDLGDLVKAQMVVERALRISEVMCGAEHPDVASPLNNLGNILQSLGDLSGARAAYERGLLILRDFLGDEHPKTMIVQNNLADVERKIREANQGEQDQ